MDEFFELYDCSEIMSWLQETPQLRQTAFERYTKPPSFQLHAHACSSNNNIINPNANKRMIEFLRKNRVPPPLGIEERERSLKHTMMERMRRKKHSQIYLALHELLPQGTKSDKNSILETAVEEIEELRRCCDELRRRNGEMEMKFENEKWIEKAQLELKVEHPASGVESMLEVLRCLKNAGCLVTHIHSTFLPRHFAATLEFQTSVRATQVEEAVQRCLFDAEIHFRHHH